MNITPANTIGAIVAQDYRTASIFDRYGIDFCCNGHRSIEEACKLADADATEVVHAVQEKIEELPDTAQPVTDYSSWPPDLLADHIEKKHHRYVTAQIPVIRGYLEKICTAHGAAHPELLEIRELFEISAGELAMHMKKEELMLFPYIKKMTQATGSGGKRPIAAFGSIQNPINAMMDDHEGEGERFRKIAALSNNYTLPADGCNTYRLALALLKEFEEDLHLHVHLENNILFPKSIELEPLFPADVNV